MSRRFQKLVDAVLDGEIGAEEGRRRLQHMGAGEEVLLELEAQLKLVSSLAALPVARPEPGLTGRIEAVLEKRLAPHRPPPLGRTARLGWAVGGALAGAAVALAAVSPALRSGPEPPPQVSSIDPCRVRSVSGEASLLAGGLAAALEPGIPLAEGNVVTTGKNGRVEIDADRDSRLVLYRQSRLQVTALAPELKSFRLLAGRASVEVLAGNERRVRLSGLGETMVEASGGAFSLLVLEEGRAAVAALQGEARVIHRGEGRTLPAGTLLRLEQGTPLAPPEHIPEGVRLEIENPPSPPPGKGLLLQGRTDSHARLWLAGERLPARSDGSFTASLPAGRAAAVAFEAEDVAGHINFVEIEPSPPLRSPVKKKEAEKIRIRSYRIDW